MTTQWVSRPARSAVRSWATLLALCGLFMGMAQAGVVTTTTLTSSPTVATAGQAVVLTATVAGSNPTGLVTFLYRGNPLGQGSLAGNTASFSGFTPTLGGSYDMSARYEGDAQNNPSTSAVLWLQSNPGTTPSTTTIAATPNPATPGQNITLNATVSGTNPQGTVTFLYDGVAIAYIGVVGNTAAYTLAAPTTGNHSVSVRYAGDATYAASASSALAVTVGAAAPANTTLIPKGATWKYLDNGSNQGNAWSATGFNDSAWASGPAQLGYGDGDEATVVGYGPNASAKYTTTYFRKSFTVANPAAIATLAIQLLRDDGAVVYLNGVELVRSNMPAGAITSSTFAASVVSGADETVYVPYTVGAAALVAGTNVIAVEIHQSDLTSSDLSFDMELVATAVVSPLPPLPNSPVPVVGYEYDAKGNPTRSTLAPGVVGFGLATTNTFDSLDRVKTTADAKTGLTQFGYNGRTDLTQITDPKNLLTQYPRNGLGDATSLVSPDTGTATHTYDAAGNLKTRTDSRGVLATYSYDPLNRLTGTAYTQTGRTTRTYTWAYDQTGAGFAYGVGRLTSTAHPDGSTQYAYDAQGRVVSDTQRVALLASANPAEVAKTVTYGYDAAGHVTSIVYPSGRKLALTYTGGQPTALGLSKDSVATATPLISGIRWEPFGGVAGWQWQMASTLQAYDRVYDSSARLVRSRLGNTVRDLTYDDGGRIKDYSHYDATTGAAIPALNQSFGYDELGRVKGITTASASWSIGYDANGNRTGVTLNGTPSTYTTSATSNQLVSTTGPARTFGYDAAGNISGDGAFTTTYNLAGRLNTFVKGGVTTTYSVDGMGRRVRKVASTGAQTTVIFVYDQGGQLLGEYDRVGTAIREYVWLGSTPVAMFTPDPVNAANPPLVYYFHTDHLDTPRVVVDKNNAVRWRWLAEPFGTAAPETNPASLGVFTQNLRFPGQYADVESGWNYNFFRDYDAGTGRYVQSDPIGLAGGINTYLYSQAAPTMFTDPDGLQVIPLPPPILPPPPVIPSPDYPYTPTPPSFTWPKLLPDSWVDKIIEMCSDTPEECRRKCDAANTEQVRICKMAPTRRAREACYSRANELYGQCLKKCK